MKNLFALVGLGTVAFVGLGWYLDWYKLSRQPTASTGSQRFQVDLNPDKIVVDVKKGIERGGEIIEKFRENEDQPTEGAKNAEQPTPANAAVSGVQSVWKSLESMPPPPVIQPVSVNPPKR